MRYLSQVYEGRTLKPFQTLQAEVNLLQQAFFQYLQLGHALNTQARTYKFCECKNQVFHILTQAVSKHDLNYMGL